MFLHINYFIRNSILDSNAVKGILVYIRQHLHLVELRFTDPFNDPTGIYSAKDSRLSDKIYFNMSSNRKMHQVSVLVTWMMTSTKRRIITWIFVVFKGGYNEIWMSVQEDYCHSRIHKTWMGTQNDISGSDWQLNFPYSKFLCWLYLANWITTC